MAAVTPGPGVQSTRPRRWLARLSFVLACLAIVILLAFAGLKSLAMLGVAVAAAVISVAAGFVFLPSLVISVGTRNHFALDLGLDREDPAACLAALADGVPRPKPPVTWTRLRHLAGPARSQAQPIQAPH
jgi:hypothetical protein